MSEMSSARLYVILFLVLIMLIAVSAAVLLRMQNEARFVITIHPPAPTATPPPTSIPAPIRVYVTGAVARPDQVHLLPHDSRVADAIEAAGGLLDGADKSLVNMAAIVRDGDQVHAPLASDENAAADLPTPSGGRRVRVNSATQAELETLPGIGPETALRIIEYRELVGVFDDLNALDNVSGIGRATLEKLADLVAFD